jgi:hypothetical protein
MSYQPFDRNPSGIVFFGTDASDQVFESNSNFTIDGTTLVATNVKISDGGNIGSASDADAISIASDGNVTMTQDLTVTGDLTVNGTTTTVSTTNTVVSDLLLELGNGTTGSAANDAGIVIERGDDDNAFIGFDESANKFTMGTGSFTGASTGDLTISAGTLVANLEGNVTGNVTGSADTLTTARDFTLTGQVTSDSAVSFDGSANAAIAVSIDKTAITDQTAITEIADGDFVLVADVSDSNNLKKITKSNFVSALGGGTMSSFNITDGSTSQQIDNGEDITFADGTGAEFVVSATNTVTVNSVDSEIVHDNLSGFVANEHIDHTSVVLSAGAGLTGGGDISTGRSFAVGAGAGIAVNTDDVAVDINGATDLTAPNVLDELLIADTSDSSNVKKADLASIVNLADHDALTNFVANEHIDHSSVTMTAGDGLTGGGTIASTRTFAVGAGTGITVNANDVQITDGGVGTTQLAADAVTGAKIADDAIDSEHYVDGSIDTAHIGNLQVTTAKIAADAITGAKIADDAIDSEHYTDGSIDAAHIASSAVTEVKRSRTVATANSTSTISNDITLATAGAAGITLTLPAAVSGKIVIVKKVDTGAGNVTLDPPGSVTIDGAATKVLYHQYETMTCVSDGTNWFIV